MEPSIRPVFATQATPLQQQLSSLFASSEAMPSEPEVLAVVVPDSNLASGGKTAANVYQSLDKSVYDTVVIISSAGVESKKEISICSLDEYVSPLGAVSIDDTLRNELCDEDDDIFLDDSGHFQGRGVDVQLPFLQSKLESFTIIPIVMGVESPEYCEELGHAIGEIMFNRSVLVVVCSELLEAGESELTTFRTCFESLDVDGLATLMNREDGLRVRGKGPLLVAMIATRYRRAEEVHVLTMDLPQDGNPGYIGALISRK